MTKKIRSAIALVCAGFVLSSCGFNVATDRENTITSGGFDLDSSVKILAARVVSAERGSGVLIGNLVNSEQTEGNDTVTLESISGEGITATDFTPIEVESGKRVNLWEDPIALTGDSIYPGSVVSLTYAFDDGTETTVIATVVRPCFEYAGIDVPGADSITCQRGTSSLPSHGGGHSEESGHSEDSGESEGH